MSEQCVNCGRQESPTFLRVSGGFCCFCTNYQDRLAALEAENARLREENERLTASVAYWQGVHGPRHEGFGHKGKE